MSTIWLVIKQEEDHADTAIYYGAYSRKEDADKRLDLVEVDTSCEIKFIEEVELDP